MIRPLQLGTQQFPVNLIQGPLAGVSCAPFRRLTWQYSQPAFSCTEMISCKTLLYAVKNNHRFLAKSPHEGPVCYQLSGKDPQELAEATKIVTDTGADLIDLNCGCPVNKIRSRGAGSKLLQSPNLIFKLIQAMKSNTHVPVSIKIRVDGQSSDQYNQEIVKVVQEAGADYLIVHGRHWTEHYETPCQYSHIQYFVEELDIPVIGNGDVACIDSLKKMFATGCAGAMIARAGVGQPWLIQKLTDQMQGKPFSPPSAQEIGQAFLIHTTELSELLGSERFAVIQARKFAKYYGRNLSERAALTDEVNTCESLSKLEDICHRYFHHQNDEIIA